MEISEMNELAKKIEELRAKEAEASALKRAVTQELEAYENQMLQALQEGNLTQYKSPFGTCGVSFRLSVKTPKTPEDLSAFYEYLKSRGLFDTMITVNSATLNSFYKEEVMLAQEKGDADFKVPGINEVTTQPILSFRRA